ncbi:MAG: META domain-containing protein [Nitrospira sp.]
MNTKKVLMGVLGFLIIGIIVYLVYFLLTDDNTIDVSTEPAKNYLDATYTIDERKVKLTKGISTEEIPNSSAVISTRYFGNEIKHDLDGDGREDVVFLLTQNGGGTGTFYYVVGALNKADGYIGGEGLFLGDRIAPQTTEISQNPKTPNVIVVNYAERKAGESFSVQPSVGKSIWILLDPKTMQFGEVAQNFEGEADPARMKLNMQTWTWINTTYNDGKIVAPAKTKAFTLIFKNVATFSATTDCNGVGGEYMVTGNKIILGKMISTLMYCEGSQEGEFTKELGQVDSYHFTSKGELVFDLKFDSGVMVFK